MDLPRTYYDIEREGNPRLFRSIKKDLRRLAENPALTEADLYSSEDDSEEAAYLHFAFAAFAAAGEPWLRNRAAVHQMVELLSRHYRFLLSYQHAGCKTYYFSDALAEQLCFTKLDMPCDQLQLPFPAFAFVFDTAAPTEAAYALLEGPMQPGITITVFVREDRLPEICFRRLQIIADLLQGDRRVAHISRQLALCEGWSLEQALRTDLDKLNYAEPQPPPPPARTVRQVGGDYDVEDDDNSAFFEEGLQFVRLILNGILYVTSRDAELAERMTGRTVRPPRTAKAKVKEQGKRPYWVVGASVESLPIVIDPLRAPGQGQPLRREARRVQVRFLVSGFWRHRPGAQAGSPRDVWVRPHYRGPEMAELVNRPYVVR